MVLTRRAHRARMLITRWLPNEVLADIIRYAAQSDRATLCRVSKLFHALVLPMLNRHVVFVLQDDGCSYHQLLENFSRAFIQNPRRADAVRSLFFYRSLEFEAPINYHSLFEAMKLMASIEYLSFSDLHEPTIATHLACLTFTNLLLCRIMVKCSASQTTDITKFCTQHPSITHLCLGTPGALGDDSFKPEQRFLPNLEQLETRSLRSVRFPPWVRIATNDVQTLKTLADPAFPFVLSFELSIQELDNVGETTLSPLSQGLAHMHSLQLQTSKANSDDRVTLGALDAITAHLSQFVCIAYFALTARRGRIVDAEGVENIFRAWAASSSTLKGCCVGEMAWTKVGKTWEQCSREEFDDYESTRARAKKTALSGSESSSPIPNEFLRGSECLALTVQLASVTVTTFLARRFLWELEFLTPMSMSLIPRFQRTMVETA
ncbi:hypothetical protein FB45DRAFT_1113461 [Roridomyces roridus]|uniref:F-box domain-containing protein n=1 Tax=Roridomyces roridus TaxID=1738132 RepID=A0AAD7C9U8_9AGAR|nr:hypothetical protein FB45DRAFT_1113461 [Roridomyces roridus]